MKVALVYDRINKWGGAERVLLALHKLWPEAPLFTAVYAPKGAPWARVFDVRPSFMQYIPLAKNHHELFPWLTPLAFETFNFDAYDLVISITSAEAKSIITKPQTMHICYCLTPTRYLWSGSEEYKNNPGLGVFDSVAGQALRHMTSRLRKWDVVASSRPDAYIAISQRIAKRIETYYHRKVVDVIYPPVETEKFKRQATRVKKQATGEYFLVVSRLVGYKRIDVAIEACNRLQVPLIIIGDGLSKQTLMRGAGNSIRFISHHLTDEELSTYYENCRALIMPQEEDFGIVAVEAQAHGKPVISWRSSGVSEVIVNEKTGLLYDGIGITSLIEALKKFDRIRIDPIDCITNAQKFSQSLFQKRFMQKIDMLYTRYKKEQLPE